MRLGIDARLLTQTGVGVYTYNLLYHLPQFLPKDWKVFVFVRSEDRSQVPHSDRYNIVKADYRWHTIAEQTGFLVQLISYKLDLMHFTYFSYPLLYKDPFVSTIHDLTPVLFKTGKASTKSGLEYYPKYFAMTRVIEQSIKNSRAIITPTEFVKRQVLKLYSAAEEKIFVTPEGLNLKLITATENRLLGKQFTKPFLLYVGNFYPHKNVDKLIEAYASIKSDCQLVLVGPEDHFSGKMRDLIKSLDRCNRIVMYHNASLSDLVFFYKHANALVHPSLSEGYGLTPMEALYFNTPVIASNIEVFKETLGDSYTAFNPNSVSDIQETIEQVLRDTPKVDASILLGNKSFKTMAKETVAVYKRALGM